MLKLFSRKKKKNDPEALLGSVLEGYELPSFPGVITSLLEQLSHEDVSLSQVADQLAVDPGLSVRLLTTVNSAAFALRNEIRSVHHAVHLLGRAQIESMLISIAVRTTLPCERTKGFHPARFWAAAAHRAAIASAFAQRIDPGAASESFTAALLLDLAVPILAHHEKLDYGSLLEQWHSGTDDLHALEQKTYGWNHCEIGALVSRKWGMPETLVATIGAHHDDDPHGPLPAARLVALLPEVEPERHAEAIAKRALEWFGLEEETVSALIEEGFARAPEVTRMLNC